MVRDGLYGLQGRKLSGSDKFLEVGTTYGVVRNSLGSILTGFFEIFDIVYWYLYVYSRGVGFVVWTKILWAGALKW